MHPMNLLLPCLASQTCLLSGGCLVMPCIALWWVLQAHKHAYLSLFLPCPNLSYLLPCLMCASYEVDVYMCVDLCYAIFPEVQSMFFVTCVLSASSSLNMVLVVTVLLGWICYIMMLCKPAATSHSVHNMEMFTKDVLLYMSCYIHSCPWLHL